MKKMIICFVLSLFLNSCSHIQKRSPAEDHTFSPPASTIDQKLAAEIGEFQTLVEEALVWRAKSVEFSQAHVNNLGKKILNHAEMLMLYDSIEKYLILRQKILASAFLHQELVDSYTLITLNTGKGTFVQTNKVVEDNGQIPAEVRVLNLDPLDEKGRGLLLRMKISLAASLVLYDNYLVGIYPYQKQKKIRMLLNEDLPGTGRELEKITENFFRSENRHKVIRAVKLFNEDLALKQEKNITAEKEEMYLETLCSQSPFFQYISTGKRGEINPNGIRAFFTQLFDKIRSTRDSLAFAASKILGNTAGLISFRHGKLNKLSREEKENITKQMQPLDILLEKTPFRLTDRMIPGYYGHVAIWAGSEDDLRALDLWDHPEIQPYQTQIREGRRIIEALRPGVQINSLEHFLNIDDLLVLRDKNLTDETRKEFILRAFSQVGKEYDFNFDVGTDKRIVCSEIVYTVFHDIVWPTKKSLSRYTISPDNVAGKALENDGHDPELETILMYKSGDLQTGDFVPKLRDLLGK